MNKERLQAIAHIIKNNPEHFNMSEGFYNEETRSQAYLAPKPYIDKVAGLPKVVAECGTCCCIAGFAVAMYSDRLDEMTGWSAVEEEAQQLLGLTWEQSTDLFMVSSSSYGDSDKLMPSKKNWNPEAYAQAGVDRIKRLIREES